jgi:hypothetical protein
MRPFKALRRVAVLFYAVPKRLRDGPNPILRIQAPWKAIVADLEDADWYDNWTV